MDTDQKAIKHIKEVWRRTNHNPTRKKPEKVISKEDQDKHFKVSDLCDSKIYKDNSIEVWDE